MGGVAGHMDHLYDNPDLTFSKMKEIMTAASNGELSTEEKVDGQNLFLSYSIPEGKAKGARNKGHYKSGGLDALGLAQKFAGRGGIEKAFTGGFDAFEKAVEALSDDEKERIFGPDANVWYNAEVMDPGSSLEDGQRDPNDPGAVNVIKYDDKTLKIHNVGHFLYNRESGEEEPIPKGALETLDGALTRMQRHLYGHNFNLARQAIIQLQKLEDDNALQTAISQLNGVISSEKLNDSNTIDEYLFSRLMNGIDTDLPSSLKEEIVKYLLKLPGNLGLRAIKKGLSTTDLQDLQTIIARKKMLLKEAILPVEMIVHDFTVEMLKGLKSVFIANTDKEVMRLKQELAQAVKAITEQGADDAQSMEIMQYHLNKIKDFSNITTPVEAIVFDYDGHTYKFAGNFAPLNQILGMFKYPAKGGKKITTENISFGSQIITEKDGKKVALLPGGFKPPHAGHYGLAKQLSSLPDIDEVVVIIGKNPRFSDVEPRITITADQSKRLWDIYTKGDENIIVRLQEGKTPVSDVYDLIANKSSFSEGDTVVLGKSDKDEGDKRYARAQSYAERHNPGVNVEEMVFPVIGGKGMGGTQLRDMIALDDKETFISKLPEHLNNQQKEGAWNIVTHSTNESLDIVIDNALEEMSSMGGGAVQGFAGSFGSPNTYNPYSRRTKNVKPKLQRPKKPKVSRAKRQRRR
jgi:hypothetical protein